MPLAWDAAPPDGVGALLEALAPSRARVARHPAFGAVRGSRAVCTALEHHVFAVWDFASLLETARPVLGELGLPVPPPLDVCGYLDAMDQAGADTTPARRFVGLAGAGVEVRGALVMAEVPSGARRFVTNTWHTVATGSPLERAAMLCFGRDELVPEELRRVLRAAPAVHRWLGRHLRDDGGACTATALELLASLCRTGDDWRLAEATASEVLAARARLWDAIAAAAAAPRRATAAARSGRLVDR